MKDQALNFELTCGQIEDDSSCSSVVNDGSAFVDVEEVVTTIEASVAVNMAELERLYLGLDPNRFVQVHRLVRAGNFVSCSREP